MKRPESTSEPGDSSVGVFFACFRNEDGPDCREVNDATRSAKKNIGERHRYLCAVLKVGTMLIATAGMWIKKEKSGPESKLQKSCATREGSQSRSGAIAARAWKLMRAEMMGFAVVSEVFRP